MLIANSWSFYNDEEENHWGTNKQPEGKNRKGCDKREEDDELYYMMYFSFPK